MDITRSTLKRKEHAMMQNAPFGRVVCAMVTPFQADGSIDFKRLESFTDELITSGAQGLLVCGTTGEAPTLSEDERTAQIQCVCNAAASRVPVLANVGSNSTAASVAFAKRIAKLPVDGLMAVVPFYNKPPQEGIYQHFVHIAHASDKPLVLYNIPGRCGINMQAETTLRLAHDVDTIVAIKEASGNIEQIQTIIDNAPAGFSVYSGDDSLTFELAKRGAAGVISTIANIAPARMAHMLALCEQDRFDDAYREHTALLPLMKGLFETANPILVKAALHLLGHSVGGLHLPLIEATPEQKQRLAALLQECGFALQ